MIEKVVTGYKIVVGESAILLSDSVNEDIVHGWQPFGNVFHTSNAPHPFIAQPMVKYEHFYYY